MRPLTPLATAVLLAALAVPALGQDKVRIGGQILDSESQEALPGVLVTAPLSGKTVLTDSLGLFGFELFRDREYQLVVEDMGYLPQRLTLGSESDDRPVTILLRPDASMLAGLATLEDRLSQRRRRGGGRVRIMEHDLLMLSPEATAYELVRRSVPLARTCDRQRENLCVPGGSSERVVRVCIDDARPSAGASELMRYEPAHLWLVEVYGTRGPVRVFTRWFVNQKARGDGGRIALRPLC